MRPALTESAKYGSGGGVIKLAGGGAGGRCLG